MRTILASVSLLLVATLVPAHAQTDAAPGCSQSNPCTWVVDVDDKGFFSTSKPLNATAGDWYVISAFNYGDAAHTLTLSVNAATLKVDSDAGAKSAPIHFASAGKFTLTDQPSGGNLALTVTTGDVVDVQNGLTSSTSASPAGSEGSVKTPNMALPLLLVGLAALALALRPR